MTCFSVPDDPPRRREENLGSKEKFWFERDGQEWLFKEARPGSGEAWAEIVAMRCAELLGLPHADYELAQWKTRRGVVSRSLTPPGSALIFGNQLLAERDPDYPPAASSRFDRVSRHTLSSIRAALTAGNVRLPTDWSAPTGVDLAADLFGGYLVLDAWIGNADRHHLNWGVIVADVDAARRLAATFDHGSALASGITDESRRRRLDSRNHNQGVEAFVRRPRLRSPFFRAPDDEHGLSPLEAAAEWRLHCDAMAVWRQRLATADVRALEEALGQVPAPWMSATAKEFVAAMLLANKRRILDLEWS